MEDTEITLRLGTQTADPFDISAGAAPYFLHNTITLTATADEQMMANGLVPVYIQYHNQLADQFRQERDWTISINANDASHVASLPLEKLDGKYAYSTDGEIVDETTGYTSGSYRYEKLDLMVRGATFRDVAADVYYALAVAWAAQRNITNGVGDGLFGSDLECTRAQIVTFLYRSAMAG